MQFNTSQREITLKVVYYGPPLSGKTTNLQMLHRLLGGAVSGQLTTLDTADDRTLFFDLLPLALSSESGYQVRLKLYTVPGQVIHAATRRLVLAGADAVAFIADSRRDASRLNNEFWYGMRRFLADNGIDAEAIPTVIQFNKRDLPNVRSDAEIDEARARGKEPIFPAVATRGEGVRETFEALLRLLHADLDQRYHFAERFGIGVEELVRGLLPSVEGGAAPSEQEGR